ncbi:hypothetical protein D1J60_10570 [Streptomyces sp. W1SF4]|nr:hypothetical protein D1J60_10570 [Streptomyces sp. W1SF4]
MESRHHGVTRTSRAVRMSLGMFSGSKYRCPVQDSMRALGYTADSPPPGRREVLEQVALRPLMDELDGRRGPTAPWRHRLDPVLESWTRHAVGAYDSAFARPDGDSGMREVPRPWTYRYPAAADDHRGATEYGITVWGRCLASADGSVRELRLPVHRSGAHNVPPEGYVALAALVTAEARQADPPEHVRVVRFPAAGTGPELLFAGTPEEARALHRRHGRHTVRALLDSAEYRPGSACGSCPFTSGCPALLRAPGLTGLSGKGRPRRTWSPTDGREYTACPRRSRARSLRLPTLDAVERSPAAERGRAVHAYLAARHRVDPPVPCSNDIPEDWVPAGFALEARELLIATAQLRRHAAVCPLHRVLGAEDVRVEPTVTMEDPAARVVVVTDPDLVYRDGGSWVWREVKSTSRRFSGTSNLMETYPQLALAVLMAAEAVWPGKPGNVRVEAEILRPHGASLVTLDPSSPAVRDRARKALAPLTDAWHADDAFEPQPGPKCADCPVSQWCPDVALPTSGDRDDS